MISRVLSEREKTEIVVFMETCEEALRFLESKVERRTTRRIAQRAQLQIERIKGLHDLGELGKKLLDGLLTTAKLDAEPLTRFMLGGNAYACPACARAHRGRCPRARAQCTVQTAREVQHRLFQGPVLAPARATGLGGAFAAYAEGVDAIASNAAAVAVREPYSFTWFDYDLTARHLVSRRVPRHRLRQRRRSRLHLQELSLLHARCPDAARAWGVGFLADFQNYTLLPAATTGRSEVTETLGKAACGARANVFRRSALGRRGRARRNALHRFAAPDGDRDEPARMSGVGPEIGVLIRPDYEPWRIGATFRAAVEGLRTPAHADTGPSAVSFVAPSSLFLPWELELGAALQVGPRPLNPRWLNPHDQEARERKQIGDRSPCARARPRRPSCGASPIPRRMYDRASELALQEKFVRREEDRRLDKMRADPARSNAARATTTGRASASPCCSTILVSGPLPDAIGLESFFSDQASLRARRRRAFKRSGQKVSYSPRLGLEGEPVPDRMQTRIGTYIEPSRFGGLARQHFTFGVRREALPLERLRPRRRPGVADRRSRRPRPALPELRATRIGAWH